MKLGKQRDINNGDKKHARHLSQKEQRKTNLQAGGKKIQQQKNSHKSKHGLKKAFDYDIKTKSVGYRTF